MVSYYHLESSRSATARISTRSLTRVKLARISSKHSLRIEMDFTTSVLEQGARRRIRAATVSRSRTSYRHRLLTTSRITQETLAQPDPFQPSPLKLHKWARSRHPAIKTSSRCL